MFALVDVNSFYASCEKVFRPDLEEAHRGGVQQRRLHHFTRGRQSSSA
jgi:nucleotidyltransferase/DNA polymerase involved in DNA repair